MPRRPPRPPESRYLHGTTRSEQRRLAALNDLMNTRSLAALALRGGERVLEMGSGLGQFARAMARAAGPRGRVVAVERSRAQLAVARLLAARTREGGRIDWRQGDATRPPLFPRERGRFDLAHARFLLEHLPDPLRVVRGMVRAVRPGGRIVLEDDDHDVLRLHPEPAGFDRLWRAYMALFQHLGNDPYVGRRLVTLLRRAGARPHRCTWIFFGSCAGAPDFPLLARNLIDVIRPAVPAMAKAGLVDAAAAAAAIRALRAWTRRPDAALWYSICWAEGTRPARRLAPS